MCRKTTRLYKSKIDAPLQYKKIKIKQNKSAKDLTQTKTLICLKNIPVVKGNTLTKIFISSKYKSLFNFDTWGNNVLPELNNTSQIIDRNIPDIYYMDIQYDNVLEHSFFMTNGCNRFGPSGICDQLKFYPNQIKFLPLSVKSKFDKLKNLINTNIFVWITTRQISYRF